MTVPSMRLLAAGGGKAVLASDSFTRADSTTSLGTATTGQEWTSHAGTWGISTNQGYKVTTTATDAWASIDVGSANVDLTCDIFTSGSPSLAADHGVIIRSDGTDFLLLTSNLSGTSFQLFKRVGGSYTALASATPTISTTTTYTVRFQANGNAISCSLNGTEHITHTLSAGDQTTFGSLTRCGLRTNGQGNQGQRWDNLLVKAS